MVRPSSLQQWLDSTLLARLERITRKRSPLLPAPQVLIHSPEAQFSFGDVRQRFHTASVGKLFVAALTARLAHDGVLTFDSLVSEVAPELEIEKLPAVDGLNLLTELKISHLLSHRSGLPDPLNPPRGYTTECQLNSLATQPDHLWTPHEVMTQTVGLPAIGRPGQRFHYSDANYALLLCTVQAATGTHYTDLLRKWIFEPAGMTHTSQPHSTASDDALAALDIAPIWIEEDEVSHRRALSVGSVDGGAVTLAEDLVRFQTALHEGFLVEPQMLAQMTRPLSRFVPGVHYGSGFATLRFNGFLPVVLQGLPQPIGGLGVTATHCFYYPRQRTHVILNLHSTTQVRRAMNLQATIAEQLRSA